MSVLIPQEFHLDSVSVDNIDLKVKDRPPAEVVDETLQGAAPAQSPGEEQ